MNRSQLREVLDAHRLTAAIVLAIGIALVLTVISVSLYIRSGASRLDLSRPGYEAVRDKVGASEDDETFSATGPINSATIDEFQAIFDKRRALSESLDPFSPSVLSDDSIRLLNTPVEQTVQ